jgi:hypothetical protein
MGAGDEFVILDVQPGDSFRIPMVAYVQRLADGSFSGTATTEVAVGEKGTVTATIPPHQP